MNMKNSQHAHENVHHSTPTTGNQGLVKDLNKAIVLNMIWRSGPISRADISRASGLNRATVSSLVDELITESYVTEVGVGESALGRKPIMLKANPSVGTIIGVDLGVNYIRLIASDVTANVVAREELVIHPGDGVESIVGTMLKAIKRMAASVPPTLKGLIGVGVGVPGLVRSDGGVLAFAPNLRWKDVPLRQILEEQLCASAFVDNEANAGAMGERWFGAGKGVQNMAYLSVGIGLGVGIVINGELYRGSMGYAGEMGHFTIEPDGPECGCGNRGCWETLASERASLGRVAEAVRAGRPTELAGREGDRLTMDDLARACADGDEVAQEALAETGRYLGIGIAGVINTFNPDLVIVGNTVGVLQPAGIGRGREGDSREGAQPTGGGSQVGPGCAGQGFVCYGGNLLVLNDLLSLPKIAL